MNNRQLEFPSALSLQVIDLDRDCLRWAWKNGILVSPEQVESFRRQKINWFAAYLYPELEAERLKVLMRFFLCLFRIDDGMDNWTNEDSYLLLKALEKRGSWEGKPEFSSLRQHTLSLFRRISRWSNSEIWRKEWKENWILYLEGLGWELTLKAENKVPELNDYQQNRGFSSGVFLAFQLLRIDCYSPSCGMLKMEQLISRLITLSNDIGSFEKERRQGDFQNELILLEGIIGLDSAKRRVKKELERLKWQILGLGDYLTKHESDTKPWVESALLLAGGCQAWSEESIRYLSRINGTVKSH
ncbi:hypothetical protein D0X99_17005 [Algoriphagus lacus]|uniref:Terpene synthase n=1 Tax=Algoriphagus lacus TaxID=2056311 RepID=A0A418PNC5_9BACT|nr:terpene synthase family protein [Algoriphagus lacus]RIW13110.1 hypothetical protein D0X99_17005 [Algoriphagus lacus]